MATQQSLANTLDRILREFTQGVFTVRTAIHSGLRRPIQLRIRNARYGTMNPRFCGLGSQTDEASDIAPAFLSAVKDPTRATWTPA